MLYQKVSACSCSNLHRTFIPIPTSELLRAHWKSKPTITTKHNQPKITHTPKLSQSHNAATIITNLPAHNLKAPFNNSWWKVRVCVAPHLHTSSITSSQGDHRSVNWAISCISMKVIFSHYVNSFNHWALRGRWGLCIIAFFPTVGALCCKYIHFPLCVAASGAAPALDSRCSRMFHQIDQQISVSLQKGHLWNLVARIASSFCAIWTFLTWVSLKTMWAVLKNLLSARHNYTLYSDQVAFLNTHTKPACIIWAERE